MGSGANLGRRPYNMTKSKFFSADCECPPVWSCPRHKPQGLDRSTASKVKKNPALKRTQALKGKSDKGYELMAFERGVVATLLWVAGRMACVTCGKELESLEAAPPSHIESRSSHSAGHGYSRTHYPDLGYSHPANILPECVPCNLKREPQPEWGTA